jgi:molybdopterin/thiamine biosynthesis adenylyltransferase/rhodanese-related sulfurtransferase
MHPDFTRYSCQLALPGFNEAIQQRLQNAKILIAGAGGLGCPSSLYLAAAGIGVIGIADYDTVSISNLHRQVLYTNADVGFKKATVATTKLQQQNPGICLISHDIKINSENVLDLISPYDLVVDGTDNFETKYLLNDACVMQGKPLVYGAIYQFEGQVSVWNVLNEDGTRSPNYRDIFPEVNPMTIPNCADGGVMPTLAGIIGCIQGNEAIKYFSKAGDILSGKLMMIDVRTMQSRIIKTGHVSKTKITSLLKSGIAPIITAIDLKSMLHTNTIELIDVRSAVEHNQFNIGGKNIPIDEIEKNISSWKTTDSIVLYCSTGKRSGEAVNFIKTKFPGKKVVSLEGGLRSWKETFNVH